jgi:hypothetical protein
MMAYLIRFGTSVSAYMVAHARENYLGKVSLQGAPFTTTKYAVLSCGICCQSPVQLMTF